MRGADRLPSASPSPSVAGEREGTKSVSLLTDAPPYSQFNMYNIALLSYRVIYSLEVYIMYGAAM